MAPTTKRMSSMIMIVNIVRLDADLALKSTVDAPQIIPPVRIMINSSHIMATTAVNGVKGWTMFTVN